MITFINIRIFHYFLFSLAKWCFSCRLFAVHLDYELQEILMGRTSLSWLMTVGGSSTHSCHDFDVFYCFQADNFDSIFQTVSFFSKVGFRTDFFISSSWLVRNSTHSIQFSLYLWKDLQSFDFFVFEFRHIIKVSSKQITEV